MDIAEELRRILGAGLEAGLVRASRCGMDIAYWTPPRLVEHHAPGSRELRRGIDRASGGLERVKHPHISTELVAGSGRMSRTWPSTLPMHDGVAGL